MKKKTAVKRKTAAGKGKSGLPAVVPPMPVPVNGFEPEQQLWRQMGRPRAFATAADLWEAACEYFKWCDENPLMAHEWKNVGKYLQSVSTPKKRPYQKHGFCMWVGLSTGWWKTFKANLDPKEQADFLAVVDKIEEIIYQQKFEGAAAGFFNPNIIARDLGLADKKENTNYNLNLGELPIEFE